MRNEPLFTKLRVWQEAHRLTLLVYKLTGSFPSAEKFGLTAQLRRSSSSVGANIAESAGRRTGGDVARFLTIARGSILETQQHLFLARDLGFLDSSALDNLLSAYQGLSAGVQKYIAYLLKQ